MDFSEISNLQMDRNAQIIDLLSGNQDVINKVSGLQVAFQQLGSNQKKLADLFLIFKKDRKYIDKVKNDFKNKLLESTLPVVTILYIFAYDKKKRSLKKQLLPLTPEYLQNCPDEKLIKISRKIWMIANKLGGYSLAFVNKNKSSLNAYISRAAQMKNEYGLVPEMIKNIEETYIKFLETLLLYEEEMKEKKKVGKKIDKISKQTEKLLVNKIDRYVQLIASDNPAFLKDYYVARENKAKSNNAEPEKDGPTAASKETPDKKGSSNKPDSKQNPHK